MAYETACETYICANCKETFEKGWSDEEAKAESTALFGLCDDLVLVCDDCFKRLCRGRYASSY